MTTGNPHLRPKFSAFAVSFRRVTFLRYMGTEFFVVTVFGPFALLGLILIIRRGMGLELYASGADVALAFAGIDFAIAFSASPQLNAHIPGGNQLFPVQKVALLLFLCSVVVCALALLLEKTAARYFGARYALSQGWCRPSVVQGIKGPYVKIVLTWLTVVVIIALNTVLFSTIL